MYNNAQKEITSVQPGRYRHYKGGLCEVIGTAHHSETLEPLTVYRALYNSPDFGENSLWVRPAAIFLESVFFNGKTVPRFDYLGDSVSQ